MQNVHNCQIIYLTNGLKIIFVETNFTPKNIINSKKKKKKKTQTAIEIGSSHKNNLFTFHYHVHE